MPIDTDCYEKVVLYLSAADLPSQALVGSGKVNPFAVLYEVDPYTRKLIVRGYTEIIQENASPGWSKSFTLNYHFEAIQEFLVKVFHHDGSSVPQTVLSKHTWLGDMRFQLSSLMCAAKQTITRQFTAEKQGTATARGEVMHHTRDNLIVTFSALKLKNKEGFFGTSDPFLKISRFNEDGTWTAVWHNDPIMNNLNPQWGSVKIPMVLLCNADLDRPLRIEVFDWDKSGKHAFMGCVESSVRQLCASDGGPLDVIEPDVQAKKGKKYTNSGTMHAIPCIIEENPTFADFITGGLEISLTVAIDFTASNGDPNSKASLHHIDPTGQHNIYQQAIHAVCSVLEPYDSDHMYPVYGFGAKLKEESGQYGKVQHCFPVYGGGLEVQGIDGIMQAYKDCLQSVMLSGPTWFGPLVNASAHLAATAACSQQQQQYSILLILTDGVINDFDATKTAIIAASQQPLSIIIVGVGNADFSEMDELDSDDRLLSHNGQTAARDIVQFVSFKEQLMKGNHSLAEAVLAEIPQQLLAYMKHNGISPNLKK